MNKATLSAIGLFLITLVSFWIVQNMSKPRILVLHSYYTDFSWVNDINIGLERILEKQAYKVRYHYMDTKRHTGEAFKQRAGATARDMIDNWQPDVIIAVDDNAQAYVSRYYVNHPDVTIIFTGVNKEESTYGYDKGNNVTGVLERINYDAVKGVLLQMLPENKRRIFHISDASPTSEGIHTEIDSFDWSPLNFIESVQCQTFDDWKKVIKEAETKTDFILYTHYHTLRQSDDPEAPNMKPKEVMDWTVANSSLPGVSFWGFYVEDGGMMAVALSPYEQGELAAEMAVDVIENQRPASTIPVKTSRLFVMYMRDSAIQKRMKDLNLPLIYEAFSRATDNHYP